MTDATGCATRIDPMVVAVCSLGITQIITWGTTLYVLGILLTPIAADTGWSLTWVSSGLTAGLLVAGAVSPAVGRAIDDHGARLVMCLGSLAVALGLGALAMVREPWLWIGVWAFLGLAMRMTLYDAAFAALVQVAPSRGRRAISYLTLFGGLASTVFWPISFWLEHRYGWRATLLVFAALNTVVCLPLHVIGLARREASHGPASGSAAATSIGPSALQPEQRRAAMVLFAAVMTATAYIMGAMAVHLVTVLLAAGLGMGAAVALAAAKGLAQTAARFVDLVCGQSLHPLMLGRITIAMLPASMVVLLAGPAGLATATVFIAAFGATNGLATIVRGAVPLALFGAQGYGTVLGRLAMPYLIVSALAPTVFSLLTDRFGPHAGTISLLVASLMACAGMEGLAAWYRRTVQA
jgi:MFS family permease